MFANKRTEWIWLTKARVQFFFFNSNWKGSIPACSCLCNQHSHRHLFNCTTLYAVFSFNLRRIQISPTSHQRPSITGSETEPICTELNMPQPPTRGAWSRVREPQYVHCIYYEHPAGLMHELSHYQRDASPRVQWLRPSGIQNIRLCCIYASDLTPRMSRIWGCSFLEIISHPDSGAVDVPLQTSDPSVRSGASVGSTLDHGVPARAAALPRRVDVSCSIWGESLSSMSEPNWIPAKVIWLEQMVLGWLVITQTSPERPKSWRRSRVYRLA